MAYPSPNSGYAEAPTPVKEPAVAREFGNLWEQLERLTQHMEALRMRLHPVLLDAKPEQPKEKLCRATPAVPLAWQLSDAAEKVSVLHALVADLQDRLEI